MDLQLLPATPGQLADCQAVFLDSILYDRFFADDAPRLARVLSGAIENGELYVATTPQGEITGAMRVSLHGFCGLYPYLAFFGVKHSARGTGVARFLLAQLDAMALAQGSKRVALMVSDFNVPAQALYASAGYRQIGFLEDVAKVGVNELILVKDLV